ncbi:MAG: ABC transporter ATP-binding protein [Nitrospinae bacterium]|nr:ABC transporter ATP-binding protein [Nitrospinota bacterium]
MTEIRFEGVTKSFKDVGVIKGIDLKIREGEFFTFVGPSGCGKSTLLNMIAGLESITEGSIYFDDTMVNDLSPKDRDVAMVFQSYALYPHMTVYENIAFPLRMKEIAKSEIDREVKRIAALIGLEEMLNKKPKELSGGQRQRVALGRAIIRRPKVFLMDEPLSNLDARLRVEMRGEIKKLQKGLKITTVYVTHDQSEALSLSDRIAVLHHGEIQQCGIPSDVYMNPSNVFVAGFIGSPSMNFIEAYIRRCEPLEIDCNGILFSVNEYFSPDLLKSGKELLLGIRPEDITVSANKSEGGIEVKVSMIESAGSFNYVDVIWNNVTVKGISKINDDFKAGSRVFIEIPLDKIILFDKKSGIRLGA